MKKEKWGESCLVNTVKYKAKCALSIGTGLNTCLSKELDRKVRCFE